MPCATITQVIPARLHSMHTLCPSYARGCYGCFGPMEAPNTAALAAWWQQLGVDHPDLARVFRTFNANAGPFREEAEAHDPR